MRRSDLSEELSPVQPYPIEENHYNGPAQVSGKSINIILVWVDKADG